ncbi:MAG TPA: hypothetical protein VHV31_15945 [Nitrolancea sp.]|nr:hypothetical protein [Nitrolancea sp.]
MSSTANRLSRIHAGSWTEPGPFMAGRRLSADRLIGALHRSSFKWWTNSSNAINLGRHVERGSAQRGTQTARLAIVDYVLKLRDC